MSLPYSSSSSQRASKSRASSRLFSHCSALNSEKRLLINLAYRALANSSVIPVSCIYGAWEFDQVLCIFPINSTAFKLHKSCAGTLLIEILNGHIDAVSQRKFSDGAPLNIRKGSVSVGKHEA